MTELEYSIQQITDKVLVIPPSRGFWVNRTEDGKHYKYFSERNVIGLDIKDITVSKLDEIRKNCEIKNGRVNYTKAKEQIHTHFKAINAKAIREELNKEKKTNLLRSISLRANQTYNFVFEQKKGDYVAIPSAESEFINIGRLQSSFLENSDYVRLQRKVDWIDTFKKTELDPIIFKAFSSHLAFYKINKYRDVILRTLYDFYFDGDDGHLVLNLGFDGKIPFTAESKFLYYFNELFSDYLVTNNLPFSVEDISTIVNLNSKGKRKLFGKKETALLAAIFISIALQDSRSNATQYGQEISSVVDSVETHLNNVSGTINREDLKNAAEAMNVDDQVFFKEILESTDQKLDSLYKQQSKINSYY